MFLPLKKGGNGCEVRQDEIFEPGACVEPAGYIFANDEWQYIAGCDKIRRKNLHGEDGKETSAGVE